MYGNNVEREFPVAERDKECDKELYILFLLRFLFAIYLPITVSEKIAGTYNLF